jgi:hypothetical protein
VTYGQCGPCPTDFDALSWLWWPVLFAGWALAAVAMGAEWVLAAPAGLGKESERE